MGYSINCFYILFLFIIVFNHVTCISDLRACANEDCSEILSYAKTMLTYMSNDKYTLSFQKNSDVIVFSKSAGSDSSLWGVAINGKRGYAPKRFLKETKKVGKIRFEVPTEYYEVVNKQLVPKEKELKSINENSDSEFSEKNSQNIPSDNQVVVGSEENNNTDSQTEVTEELTSQEEKDKLAIFSGVSAETVDSNINASPASQYVVIDGTTLPPSLNDESKESVNEESSDNSKGETSVKNQEGNSQEDRDSIEAVESSSTPTSVEMSHEPSIQNTTPYSKEINSSEIVENKVDDSAEIPRNTEEMELKTSTEENVDKPDESKSLPVTIPVTKDSSETLYGEQNSDSIVSQETLDSKPLPSVENIESHEPLTVRSTESPPVNESLNIPEDTSNSPSDPDTQNATTPDEPITDNIQQVVQPTVEISEPVKVKPLPNPENNFYLLPPTMNIPQGGPYSQLANKQEIIPNEINSDNNSTNDLPNSNNLQNSDINVNIEQSSQSSKMVSDQIPSSDITNPQDNTVVSSSTESLSSFTTFSNPGYEIPMIPEPVTTESVFTDMYTSSTIPPIAIPEHETSDSHFSDQNNTPDVEFNNYFQNTFDHQTESTTTKHKEKEQTEEPTNDVDKLNVEEKQPPKTHIEESAEHEIPLNNDKSIWTNILEMFGYITDPIFNLFKSGDKVEDEASGHHHWREEKLSDDADRNIGGWNAFIASFLPAYQALPQCRPEDNVIAMSEVSTDLVLWLVISAVSVLAFTLGYYFLENRKQDGKLLAMVNSLQKELLCSSKECILLKDELTITKEKLMGIEDSSFGSDEMVACLRKEIADAQHVISDLQDRLTQTEEELANSTEAALELQAILDEQLSSKDTNNSSLTFTVSNLQAQLDEQQTTMNLTKGQLAAKVEENEVLMAKIMEVGNKTLVIEKELADTQNQLHQAREEYENKSQQLHELSTTMEKSLQELRSQKATEIKDLQSQLKNCKSELESSKVLLKARAHEVASLQENLKLLKIDGTNIDALIDASHTKAELTQATTEKNILAEKLEKEQSLLHELTNKVEVQENQMKQMRDQLNEAEQKAIQATSRLDVLTNYFNQKEAELIKELNTKEGLWLSQQGENMSTVEKIQNLQQEIQQYKETTESVRRELAEQEAAWRARNAALERKSHEQWLARRAAERQAEAAAAEAQSLRQRLAAPSPSQDKPQGMVSPLNTVEGLGDLPLLPPPHLPFPPFPPPFLPPPLPPHRPPPLGRLSSPPPLPPQHMRHDRYSPDSRYSPDRDRDYSPDRRSTPQHRGRSPYSQDGRRRPYNSSRRYDHDDRYYDSGEDGRSHRRYEETETDLSPPPSPPRRRAAPRNHKGVSSGSGQSSESLERLSKHSIKY